MSVSIPVYTVKGLVTTCVPQFLEHAPGIHPPDAGSDVRTSPAGGRPFSSPIPLPSAVSELLSGISSVSPYSTATERVKLLHRARVTHCPGAGSSYA